ncbi:MAG: helix-turn-helix domain-containing protein [Treponema sp.]|uniref:helix-turn-helix domain-containing protein n=1 Tax=Treponema sp. TaxID=166 RepID=UPI00298E47B1|nr:helix-turn-helix transcriptional regulator [Treponema sp.]MCR5385842.1 helix-turn-helix domain-containing protein [Treponema sp.]
MGKKNQLSFIAGKNLQILRKQNHLTQADLAEKLGISISHVANIESRRTSVSLELIEKILKLFDITPNDLLLDNYSVNKKENTSKEKVRRIISTKINSLAFELYHDIEEYVPDYPVSRQVEYNQKPKKRSASLKVADNDKK